MRTINLTKAQLRVLTLQLEQKGDGFTIVQIRSLDKALGVLEKPIKGFNTDIDNLLKSINQENQNEVNFEVQNLIDTEGKDKTSVELEDSDFEFIKELWVDTKGFRGEKNIREVVIAIDDSLSNSDPKVN